MKIYIVVYSSNIDHRIIGVWEEPELDETMAYCRGLSEEMDESEKIVIEEHWVNKENSFTGLEWTFRGQS